MFAVFDGHGGEQVAIFCEKYMPEILMSNEQYRAKNYEQALIETFVELDWLLLSDEGMEKIERIMLEMKQAVRGTTAKFRSRRHWPLLHPRAPNRANNTA